jgi:hypothetical protein
MNSRIKPKPRITASFLVFMLSVQVIFGQVLNGSFESGSNPDLSHWEWICSAEPFQDAPAGGGEWCMRVWSGNTQGCFPGYAYQKLINIIDGQSFILSGWALRQTSSSIGIFLGTINNGHITLQEGDTTHSTSWTKLSVQSCFSLCPGDTAIVLLNAGLTAGFMGGAADFDLIDLQAVSGTDLHEWKQGFKIYPNPFSASTTLSFRLGKPENLHFTVYNLQSKIVYSIEERRNAGEQQIRWNAEGLPAGMYYYRIQAGDKVCGGKLVKVNDK